MRRIALALVAVASLMFVGTPAYAVEELQQYQPGPRLIDGTQLNKMVDAVNSLNSGLATYAGEIALDGSNPTPVTTGLTSITACNVSVKKTTAPDTTPLVSYSTTAGVLNLYGWKFTTLSNNTLTASTGTDTIGWICSGTK